MGGLAAAVPEGLPYYAVSLALYGGFFLFVVVRLIMHLQCSFSHSQWRSGGSSSSRRSASDSSSSRRCDGRCSCTANYKSHSHLFIAVFLFFRTCDFLACILRCQESATLCENFDWDSVRVRCRGIARPYRCWPCSLRHRPAAPID
jgi:hypothetical protein